MPALCLYFQVHQPLRLKKYRMFDIGHDHQYFNDSSDSNRNNLKILSKVAAKSYLPTNAILAKILKNYPQFKVSFSFSGVFLEQLEEHLPHVLESFQELVATGRVEVVYLPVIPILLTDPPERIGRRNLKIKKKTTPKIIQIKIITLKRAKNALVSLKM